VATGAGKKTTIVAKDIVFGDPIAREEFAMPQEAGVEVRMLPQVNQWEIVAQVMNLLGPAYHTLAKDLTRN